MPKWIHVLLVAIWIITGCVFSKMAYDANQSLNTKLPRYTFRIPPENQVAIGNVRFQDVINGIADAHDEGARLLEDSIRKTSRTSFWLNFISAIAAFFGFVAQLGQYLHDLKKTL